MRKRRLLPGVLALATATACGRAPADPSNLGRLATTTSIVFAHELGPVCALETLPPEASPSSSSWQKLDTNRVANQELTVVERQVFEDKEGLVRQLLLRDPRGRTFWVRNAPAARPQLDRAWRCAVTGESVAHLKQLDASTVRLVPSAPTCRGLTPVLGRVDDVSFEPYTVLGRRLYVAPEGPLAAAVTLRSADGGRMLTIPGNDLDACFAVTKRPAPKAEEVGKVMDWVRGGMATSAPDAPLDDYLWIAGIEPNACLAEGEGPTKHQECRGAAHGVSAGAPGPFGAPELRFVRQRIAGAVHGYGGKLASAEELAQINVLVTPPRVHDGGPLPEVFTRVLSKSLEDEAQQKRRAANGYRLLGRSDSAVTTNYKLELDVAYAMPKLETFTANKQMRRSQGKQSTENPAARKAAQAVTSAKAAAETAARERATYAILFDAPRPPCSGHGARAACDVSATTDPGAARERVAADALTKAEVARQSVPAAIEQDRVVWLDYRAKVLRRQGEAAVTVKLTPAEGSPNAQPLQLLRKVPFEAADEEIAADPARGIDAKSAKAPEREQVDAALAAALLADLDDVLRLWMMRSTASVQPPSLEPGSRAHLTLLARHAASNRRVKRISDVLDERADKLQVGSIEYPLNVPAGAGAGCFTFVVAPVRPRGVQVDLVLRTQQGRILVGRDPRSGPEGALDVCGLAPGGYLLEVRFPGAAPSAMAVGMFDSTPGRATDADVAAALSGAPPPIGRPTQPASVPAAPKGAK